MNRRWACLFFVAAAFSQLVGTKRATATLLAYDSFSDPAGTLQQQTGGIGFSSPWSVQLGTPSEFSVVPGSLAIPGYSGVGNSATINGTAQQLILRFLSSTYGTSGTDLWFSFIERVDSLSN